MCEIYSSLKRIDTEPGHVKSTVVSGVAPES